MNESWRGPDRVELNGSAASFSFTTGAWNELQHGKAGTMQLMMRRSAKRRR